MIKHLVFWKLADKAEGNDKATNALLIKEKLESLNGEIAGMRHLEVGVDYPQTPDSFDVALYSEFESRDALNAYQEHPKHKVVQAFVKLVRIDRKVVDYEI
jgi:hypothetical protein